MIPNFPYLKTFLRNYSRYSLQGFKMYYLEFFPHLMLSTSIIGVVSSLVSYMANLGKFFAYFCLLHEILENFVLQVKSFETQYKWENSTTQYGVMSTYNVQRHTREGKQGWYKSYRKPLTYIHFLSNVIWGKSILQGFQLGK